MSYVSHLVGLGSGVTYAPDSIMNVCPQDGRPVEMVLDLDRLSKDRIRWFTPARRSMWRFGALLALDYDNPADRQHVVTLGEGCTRLHDLSSDPLARAMQLQLQIKDEGGSWPGYGHNPTGSFKDRGMAMVVSMARRLGIERLAIPTQGNAGDSLAVYAVEAGLEIAVVMPDDTPLPILERVRALSGENECVHLETVRGTIREAGELVKSELVPRGFFNVATFQEPGWRIEGKKTLGLELAETDGGWELPDVIVYPTGGGTGILGMWKAFAELQGLGLIGAKRPRMIAVQSEATQPIVTAMRTGAADTCPVTAGTTIATGLNVPRGVGHFRVLEILRESRGTAIAVDDASLRSTMRVFEQRYGWRVGPEGAATLAGLPELFESGHVARGERVVLVNTGAYEKYFSDEVPAQGG